MTKKSISIIAAISLCLAAAQSIAAAENSTHIKAANKDRSIKVSADITAPSGFEGPVTSVAGDSIYYENTGTGEWASFTCITYMSAEEMEKAYDEDNGDAIIAEQTHSVGSPEEIVVDSVTGSKRSVVTKNPVTGEDEAVTVGIIPQKGGCLMVKSSAQDSLYEDILSCIHFSD